MAYRYSSSTNGNHRTVSRTSVLRGRRSAAGRRKTLPPHLLPGVARRRSTAGKAIGVLVGLAVAFFLFFAATVVAGALSTAAAVAATVQQYQEINGSLPNAAVRLSGRLPDDPHSRSQRRPLAGDRRSGLRLADVRSLREDLALPDRRHHRLRGCDLLEPRRCRAVCHRPWRAHHRRWRGIIRRIDHHPATRPLGPSRGDWRRGIHPAQMARGIGGRRARTPVLEARYPHHVPQPDLLRQPLVRHRGGGADLLPQVGGGAEPVRGIAARRHSAAADQLQPGPLSGQRASPAEIRPRPDGQARLRHARGSQRGLRELADRLPRARRRRGGPRPPPFCRVREAVSGREVPRQRLHQGRVQHLHDDRYGVAGPRRGDRCPKRAEPAAVLRGPKRRADRRRPLERRNPGHGRIGRFQQRRDRGPGQHHDVRSATGVGDQAGRLRGGLRAGLDTPAPWFSTRRSGSRRRARPIR